MSLRTVGKIVTTVCFNEDMYDRLERIREERCMTRSRYIQEALKAKLEADEASLKKEKQNG